MSYIRSLLSIVAVLGLYLSLSGGAAGAAGAVSGSFTINSGAEYVHGREVELTIYTDFALSREMRFSNDGAAWSEWEPAGRHKTWTLTDEAGYTTVYMELRDEALETVQARNVIERFVPEGGELVYDRHWSGDLLFADGIAVDSTGAVYVANTHRARVDKWDVNGQFVMSFQAPYGQRVNDVAVDSGDRVYVVYGAEAIFGVGVYDADGNYLRDIGGGSGSGDGQFQWPQSVAIHPGGDVYVADTGNDRVQKFDEAGHFIAAWGERGSGEGQFLSPYGIAVSPDGSVFVSDRDNHRIQVFETDGHYVTEFGEPGYGNGMLESPRGLALDGNQTLYVADTLNHRIQAFSAAGEYVGKWGRSEDVQSSGYGEFNRPADVAFNAKGEMFVVEANGGRVQVFSPVPTDADLSGLTVTPGIAEAPFGPTTEVLKVRLQHEDASFAITPSSLNSDASITIEGETVATGQEWVYPRELGFETVSIQVNVTSADGMQTRNYKVEVTRPRSNNAWLADLTPSAGNWNFEQGFGRHSVAYTLRIPPEVEQVSLTPITENEHATITYGEHFEMEHTSIVSGEAVNVSLGAEGESKMIYFEVTAQDGIESRTYRIELRRASSPDNTLLGMTLGPDLLLQPAFDPEVTQYTLGVGHEVDKLTFTPQASSGHARVHMYHRHESDEASSDNDEITDDTATYVVPLKVGKTVASAMVTAQNGTIRIYSFTIVRAGSGNNRLFSLQTDAEAELSPEFDHNRQEYSVTVPSSKEMLSITAVAEETNAVIRIHDSIVAGGASSTPIPLSVGRNEIPVLVTAQNGEERLYRIIVEREPSSEARLTVLALSEGAELTPDFDPEELSYRAIVSHDTNSMQVLPATLHPGAAASIAFNGVPLASSDQSVALTVGDGNVFTIDVTAEDGATTRSYSLQITREKSGDAALSSLTSSAGEWSGEFLADMESYTVFVGHETDELSLMPVTSEPHSTVEVSVQYGGEDIVLDERDATFQLHVGMQRVQIEVTAQNGTVKKRYTLQVVRWMPGNGDAADPYEIRTPSELDMMRYDLAAHYVLTNDIDLADRPWMPVGSEVDFFTGVLDGAGYRIANMTIQQPEKDYVGLFAVINGMSQEISVKNVRLGHSRVSGNGSVGTLVGEIQFAKLDDIRVEDGMVSGEGGPVGGIAGLMVRGQMNHVSFQGDVEGLSGVGGLAGMGAEAEISRSYTEGTVTAGMILAGGIAGTLDVGSRITQSYSVSDVSAANFVGGLAGQFIAGLDSEGVVHSYAAGKVAGGDGAMGAGGLIGLQDGVQANGAYWNTESTGQPTSAVGEPLDDSEMRARDSFLGWNFDEIWSMAPGPYPKLQAFLERDSGLSGLTVNVGTISPEFASDVREYTVDVSFAVDQLELTPQLSGTRSVATVAGMPVSRGETAVVELSAGMNNIEIRVTAEDGSSSLYSLNVKRNSPAAPEPPPAETGDETAELLINGKSVSAGKVSTSEREGRSVVHIRADQLVLEGIIEAEGQGAVLVIPVTDPADIAIGELNGRIIKSLEENSGKVEIRTEQSTYTLPAVQIRVDELAKQWGSNVELQNIAVHIEVAAPSAAMRSLMDEAEAEGEFELMASPTTFKVTAIYKEQTIEILSFGAYIKRTIRITSPVGAEPVVTGIVMEPDGSFRHVPTKLETVDGQTFAVMNSLTNSTYAVVRREAAFSDLENHWAQEAVTDMASRIVINGMSDGSFRPDQDITRAEFAAILAGGLGLAPLDGGSSFRDVGPAAWYSGVLHAAHRHELLNGYEDGTFRPMNNITREEAMVAVARTMKLVKLQSSSNDPSVEANAVLGAYRDAAEVSLWAMQPIAEMLKAGLLSGRGADKLAPHSAITRAEAAVLVRRLLQAAHLIS